MEWRQFILDLGALPADRVEEILTRHGAEAVTFTGAGSGSVLEPAPGETPMWAEARITGLFSASADFDALRFDLLQSLQLDRLPEHRVEVLEDRVWEREWLRDFHPMQFGNRLRVCPRGVETNAVDAVVLHLDPGLAFGTGTHPTTALCLEWLDGLELADKRVLDFGCGSGILSIAALLLGARTATAFDIDPQAITASVQNAVYNSVEPRLTATMDEALIEAEYDVVVANILAAPLIRNAGTISGRVVSGGKIALSGLMEEQAEAVAAAYRDSIRFEPPAVRGEWLRLTGTKI